MRCLGFRSKKTNTMVLPSIFCLKISVSRRIGVFKHWELETNRVYNLGLWCKIPSQRVWISLHFVLFPNKKYYSSNLTRWNITVCLFRSFPTIYNYAAEVTQAGCLKSNSYLQSIYNQPPFAIRRKLFSASLSLNLIRILIVLLLLVRFNM